MTPRAPYAIIDLGPCYEVRCRATGAVLSWRATLAGAEDDLTKLLRADAAASGVVVAASARATDVAVEGRGASLARVAQRRCVRELVYVPYEGAA